MLHVLLGFFFSYKSPFSTIKWLESLYIKCICVWVRMKLMCVYTEQHRCVKTIIDFAGITQLQQNVKQGVENGSRARTGAYTYLHSME